LFIYYTYIIFFVVDWRGLSFSLKHVSWCSQCHVKEVINFT